MSGRTKKLDYAPEECFILRLPEQEASSLSELLKTKASLAGRGYTIDMKGPDPVVTIAGRRLRSKLVNLPTLVEVHKTMDQKHVYKCGDIHQMVVCEDPDTAPKPRKDGNEADDESVDHNSGAQLQSSNWLHGLSRPLKNVRRKRFRKTAPMLQHSPEVEDAVNELLERDRNAIKVTLEKSMAPLANATASEVNDVARLGDVEAEAAAKEKASKGSDSSDTDDEDMPLAQPQQPKIKLKLPGDSNLQLQSDTRTTTAPSSIGSQATSNRPTAFKLRLGGSSVLDMTLPEFDPSLAGGGSTAGTDIFGGSDLDFGLDNVSMTSANQPSFSVPGLDNPSRNDPFALDQSISLDEPELPPPELPPTLALPGSTSVAQPPILNTSATVVPAPASATVVPAPEPPPLLATPASTTPAAMPPTLPAATQAAAPANVPTTTVPQVSAAPQTQTTAAPIQSQPTPQVPLEGPPPLIPSTEPMDQGSDQQNPEIAALAAKVSELEAQLAIESRPMKRKQLERQLKQAADALAAKTA
eukprot:m.45607 g.45607  ORF g.45607 m.45607 type:complete len:527 (-) comp13095_c0_seq2:38-1618(-)